MDSRNFQELLEFQWSFNNHVCLGLDSEYSRIPESLRRRSIQNTLIAFNQGIVDATKDAVCAYKLNFAFYLKYGSEGIAALRETVANIRAVAREIPTILDGKHGDTVDSNVAYALAAFESFNMDAVTVNPYAGMEPLQPFFDHPDKGVIILCHTSNKGANFLQDKTVSLSLQERKDFFPRPIDSQNWEHDVPDCLPVYQYVGYHVSRHWNKNGNCVLSAGATYPADIAKIRRIDDDMPLLILGNGTQGGDIEKTVTFGKSSRGLRMIVNFSRSIIFASQGSDCFEAARNKTIDLGDTINQYRLNNLH